MVGISLEEALNCLLEESKRQEAVECCLLHEGNGRILAKDYNAPIDNPPFNRSPLDGYAFRAIDSEGASSDTPVRLKVVGEAYAGEPFQGSVAQGEAVRIMTGAAIPADCDCVLRQEDTDEGDVEVALYVALKPYANYCYQGEDIKQGTTLLQEGEKLTPVKLGVLASMGIATVDVYKRVSVGLICTGDELVEPGNPLGVGKIYNSNQVMLRTALEKLGVSVTVLQTQGDTEDAIASSIEKYAAAVDLVVVTGGVSVGKKDRMHQVIEVLGAKRLFWRVAIQPGTPVLAAHYKEKLIIGLSGNPFAALVNFELLVRPLLAHMAQDETILPRYTTAVLETPFYKKSTKRRFIRVNYQEGHVRMMHANHASGALYSMSLCNALIDIPANTAQLEVGETVRVIVVD